MTIVFSVDRNRQFRGFHANFTMSKFVLSICWGGVPGCVLRKLEYVSVHSTEVKNDFPANY